MMYVALIAGAVVAVFAMKAGVSAFSRSQARDYNSEEWNALFRADVRQMMEWERQLNDAIASLEKLAADAPADLAVPLSPETRALARDYWGQVFDLTAAIDAKAGFHRDFVLWLKRDQRTDFIRGFLICDAADLMVHDAGLRLADSMGGVTRWERILNEASPALGLPEGTFDRLKRQVITPERASRQFAARQYLEFLRLLKGFDEAVATDEAEWLLARADQLHEAVRAKLLERGFAISVQEVKDLSADVGFEAWFPVQKSIANAMGNVRFKRPGAYLASAADIQALCEKLQPGDVCIARKNWYLSNAGIPGFWPHAAMYLGTVDDLKKFFDDPEVDRWCEGRGGDEGFVALLERRYPAAWERYSTYYVASDHINYPEAGPRFHKNAIIESIADGVVFRPPVETFGADYIGVVRPRLSKIEIAQAIERAFSHAGKPYDYNFDFTTDSALVCSELVFKSYQPAEGFNGIRLELTKLFERSTLPPNDIVKTFDAEFDGDGRQFDFVAFLDASEADGKCFWGTLDEFRQSWRRPKWDILQK